MNGPVVADEPPTLDELESWDVHDAQDELYMLGLYDDPTDTTTEGDER